MTKYIIVTGGVLSGLGKGIATAAIGTILRSRKVKVDICKIDPYLNVDPGLMNPYQHGEVWVTKDGYEADLDFGHYERFLDVELDREHNITTGKVYLAVLEGERKGAYLGQTVQIIPHITDEIKDEIYEIARVNNPDVLLVEIGGTTGDIEGMPFLEALRQMRMENGKENVLFVHVTLVPTLKAVGEQKTKPTQHSVKELRSIGIQPDIVICRTQEPLQASTRAKISLFCDVGKMDVISNHDVDSVYEVPLVMDEQGLGDNLLAKLSIKEKGYDMKEWKAFVEHNKNLKRDVRIAIVGKYTDLRDSYISIVEALKHAGYALNARVEPLWVESLDLEDDPSMVKVLEDADGILVPGGFGKRGSEGKILATKYSRESDIPYLGICFGFQLAAIEFARNALGLKNANSSELDPKTPHPVIDLLPEQKEIEQMGGTMRLGEIPLVIEDGTLASEIYGKREIGERHRHRYEVNPKYIEEFEKHGMRFSAKSDDGRRMEILEIPEHTHFLATQFHPEFKSRPQRPAPVFKAFVEAALNRKEKQEHVRSEELHPGITHGD
ncbi:MAG: CTP synthase (glutamine hydrolyzing) [Candidatus Hydrothermarchaeales archaeon]